VCRAECTESVSTWPSGRYSLHFFVHEVHGSTQTFSASRRPMTKYAISGLSRPVTQARYSGWPNSGASRVRARPPSNSRDNSCVVSSVPLHTPACSAAAHLDSRDPALEHLWMCAWASRYVTLGQVGQPRGAWASRNSRMHWSALGVRE
jgi:hypothetical protein